MSKITEAIAKARGPVVDQPARRMKRFVPGDAGGTFRERTRRNLPFSPARIQTNIETLKLNRVIHEGTTREVMSAYRMLRSRLLHLMRANQWQTLAVTSASTGDGKSLTAINLAIVLAREGSHNVFLIDLDLINPSINRYMGLNRDEESIDRFYTEDLSVADLLITTEQSGLFVLANSGLGIENSSEIISSERTESLLSQLKSLDPDGIFVFDVPPVLSADDVVALAPQIDAALIVVSEGKTTRENAVKMVDLLKETDIEVAGVLLNNSSEGNVGAYY